MYVLMTKFISFEHRTEFISAEKLVIKNVIIIGWERAINWQSSFFGLVVIEISSCALAVVRGDIL